MTKSMPPISELLSRNGLPLRAIMTAAVDPRDGIRRMRRSAAGEELGQEVLVVPQRLQLGDSSEQGVELLLEVGVERAPCSRRRPDVPGPFR
jgi:hypothetical protein